MNITLDPLEIRIVRLLMARYPITVEELRGELSVRPSTLTRALKSLTVKGVVSLEPLPDKTYIRLLVPDIGLEGDKARKRTQDDHEDDDSFTYA
jgi:DNA-binding MarR family transcriptional regulator